MTVPMTGEEGTTPVTGAGRVLFTALAIFSILCIAAYTASLTILLFDQNRPVATITSIEDFVATGQPACIRSTSKAPLEFMKANYPRVSLVIVNGTEPEMAEAVMQGRCAGAVSTDVHFRHLLNTDNSTCPLHLVGSTLSFGYYAMPWRRVDEDSFTGTVFPLSVLLMDLIETNQLIELANEYFPVQPGQDCGRDTLPSNQSVQLDLDDLAGVFVLMAIFVAATLVMAGLRYRKARLRAKRLQVPLRTAFTTRSIAMTMRHEQVYPALPALETRETLQLSKRTHFGSGGMELKSSGLSSMENGSSGAAEAPGEPADPEAPQEGRHAHFT